MNTREPALSSEQAHAAQLIGVDWGSTSLRVNLLGAGGQILATRSAQSGASLMQGAADFAATLQAWAGDWMQLHQGKMPVIACGMVGSKHGWVEVPYLATPTDLNTLARRVQAIPGTQVWLVPGLISQPVGETPDVMRGEETQLVGAMHSVGALNQANEANQANQANQATGNFCVVMPGTHSKWVALQRHQIVDFATHMTGELYAVLSKHSVLGRLLPAEAGAFDEAAFLLALDAVRDHRQTGLSHQLFAVRTLGLTGQLSAQGLADYLSGLLVGHEIQCGLAWCQSRHESLRAVPVPIILVGEPALCQRYQLALRHFGQPAQYVLPNTAPAGLWSIAHAAGLTVDHYC